MDKKFIYTGMFVGSLVGGYIPSFWGASLFSLSVALFTAIGGFLGIYLGYKLAQ